MKRPLHLALLLSALALNAPASAQSVKTARATQAAPYSAYLFAYFTGNDKKANSICRN